MKKDVEQRIAELAGMTDAQLKSEHFSVFGWTPIFEGRKETIEKLTAHLREQAAQPDSTTDTGEN
jgi:hypothetical protein